MDTQLYTGVVETHFCGKWIKGSQLGLIDLIRVKELFAPIVLQKKGDGFLLFLKAFS